MVARFRARVRQLRRAAPTIRLTAGAQPSETRGPQSYRQPAARGDAALNRLVSAQASDPRPSAWARNGYRVNSRGAWTDSASQAEPGRDP
jgi:hypothetical protein